MNTQQSSENPRRAATTATIRAYLVPVLVILLVITGGFSIYALNTGPVSYTHLDVYKRQSLLDQPQHPERQWTARGSEPA